VPGATLYHEAVGSGPLLLAIPGGAADAGVFAGLAAALADRYSVVAYDPRGNSRSVADGHARDQDLDVHGDDAAALIAAVGGEPAYVLGSSGGAQVGLDLAARHPERVRTLVAHEQPCVELLPDPAEDRAAIQDVQRTYLSQGVEAGLKRFEAAIGMERPPEQPREPPPEMLEGWERIAGNLDFFLAHGVRPISATCPTSPPCAPAHPGSWSASARPRGGTSSPTAPRWRWPSGSAARRWPSPATTAASPATRASSPGPCTRS
jgi:pimeloyl-ACP methyl ester carboxylesterase